MRKKTKIVCYQEKSARNSSALGWWAFRLAFRSLIRTILFSWNTRKYLARFLAKIKILDEIGVHFFGFDSIRAQIGAHSLDILSGHKTALCASKFGIKNIHPSLYTSIHVYLVPFTARTSTHSQAKEKTETFSKERIDWSTTANPIRTGKNQWILFAFNSCRK